MAGGEPEKGDKVSWNWGGGAPGGTVAEKKTEGEIAITSKRGNKIKKNAEPNNPAVHVERSGNDVVKKASELNVEKKAGGGGGGGGSGSNAGKKRKHKDEEEDGDEEPTKENKDGKEVRPGGKTKANKGDSQTNGAKKARQTKSSEGAKAAPKKKSSKPRATEGVGSRTRSRK